MHCNLSGILAPDLGQLVHMKRLNFMWNNISGSIPKEIGTIIALEQLLLSGNQLWPLPDELGYLSKLKIFQLDLNLISGSIPKSFVNLPKVQHFHMNNNSFSGQLPPELSALPLHKRFLLDNNKLTGYLPAEYSKMLNLTILKLNNNNFEGNEIPDSYGYMSKLIVLSPRNCNLDLSKNQLTGNIPVNRLSNNITTINFQNNLLSDISGVLEVPPIVTLMLHENPVCLSATQRNISLLCGSDSRDEDTATVVTNPVSNCPSSCPPPYEYIPGLPADCFCARGRSPAEKSKHIRLSSIPRFIHEFITGNVKLYPYQLFIDSQAWEEVLLPSLKGKGMSKGTLAGIMLGSIFCASMVLLVRKVSIIIDGVKAFSFKELQAATSRFSIATQVGRRGYGKVFKGTLTYGTVVAMKRAQQGSLQGEKEFYTEIEMLSR
ncbi:probable LRR receptor-like serine threonine-kinase At1g06840 isoform X1 [Olea europaea subsp. europaea]|uniref:Probable LRR receptor-like serine threonine-kinase At1g06840 isoform X1 n=1 Tax=Olea europaea subsp. europaea TaxID=158383 RepID=A0A8S0SCW5_OLEEU|nr:probable LRR receptor-like serine threonine-kinase At1g06840 isoform X1 [Olea europaea subsp. europaea]